MSDEVIDLPDEAIQSVNKPSAATDCILISVERDESGAIKTGIAPQGDIRITEVATIVQIALTTFKQENGLL